MRAGGRDRPRKWPGDNVINPIAAGVRSLCTCDRFCRLLFRYSLLKKFSEDESRLKSLVGTGKVANRVKKSLKAAAAKKSFLLFGSLGLHNLSNGVEEAPHPRLNVIAEAEINTTQIPKASEAKF